MGIGGEWELRERNDSHKYSRSYPWELLGHTPLIESVCAGAPGGLRNVVCCPKSSLFEIKVD